eukprot:2271481-Pleurochrysis_carterae.AAC.2
MGAQHGQSKYPLDITNSQEQSTELGLYMVNVASTVFKQRFAQVICRQKVCARAIKRNGFKLGVYRFRECVVA